METIVDNLHRKAQQIGGKWLRRQLGSPPGGRFDHRIGSFCGEEDFFLYRYMKSYSRGLHLFELNTFLVITDEDMSSKIHILVFGSQGSGSESAAQPLRAEQESLLLTLFSPTGVLCPLALRELSLVHWSFWRVVTLGVLDRALGTTALVPRHALMLRSPSWLGKTIWLVTSLSPRLLLSKCHFSCIHVLLCFALFSGLRSLSTQSSNPRTDIFSDFPSRCSEIWEVFSVV